MTKNNNITPCPEATLRRLPLYWRLLKTYQNQDRQVISCTKIADELNQTAIQVRKDLAATGIIGKPRTGYEIESLIQHIETYLGWKNTNDAFLVGAGNLGRALLGYHGFSDYKFNIVAAFDADPKIVGQEIHNRKILHLDKLPNLAQRMHINIGIITVPAEHAQEVADIMTLAGIIAIWNFAPTKLQVHPDTILVNIALSSNLAILTNKLHQRLGQTNTLDQ